MAAEPVTGAQLLAVLQAMSPEDLAKPVVIAYDCWQYTLLNPEQLLKPAMWTGEAVGCPTTAEYLEYEREWMGEDYVNSFDKPCLAIGYISE